MVEPDFPDTTLSFGAMQIGSGTAFAAALPAKPASGDLSEAAVVGKSLTVIDGRQILVEACPHEKIAPLFEGLGKGQARNHAAQPGGPDGLLAAPARRLPAFQTAAKTATPLQMAQYTPADEGVVVDYVLVGSSANFTFQSDIIYLVSSPVILIGVTIFE